MSIAGYRQHNTSSTVHGEVWRQSGGVVYFEACYPLHNLATTGASIGLVGHHGGLDAVVTIHVPAGHGEIWSLCEHFARLAYLTYREVRFCWCSAWQDARSEHSRYGVLDLVHIDQGCDEHQEFLPTTKLRYSRIRVSQRTVNPAHTSCLFMNSKSTYLATPFWWYTNRIPNILSIRVPYLCFS